MAAAFPTIGLDMALGGSFRGALVDETYTVGSWPLAELISTTARDISGNGLDGTYTGTGFTRGVTVDLPEGAIGLTFDGNGYIAVPDDPSLSLVGAEIDLIFLIKTSTNDATLRAIVQKADTNSSGNGWYAALQSGAIVFSLKVAAVSVFNFSRGAVSDGAWHLIQCCYEPGSSRARIFIDGSASGATVTSVTTLPATTTADLRIGTFSDGAGDFIGTLAYVTVGTEGQPTLSTSLQAARTWTDVSTDLRANLDLQYGIAGTKALDRVAGTGVLDFILENSSSNSAGLAGYYSPAHANVRSGFTLGIPVRLRFVYSGTTYYKFRGTITGIRPVPGIHGARATMVKAADWMNLAAQTMASTIDTQVNVNSTDVVRAVMDIADRTPAAVSIATGSDTFPFALDNSRGESMSIMQEFTRYSVSEFGYVYLKGDTTQGGVLTIESRARRQLLASPVTTFSDTMQDMELEYDEDSIINSVFVMIYPRQVGTPATVLYTLQQHQDIENGTTLTLRGQYVDPLQRASRVGAIDLVTPVAYTDYTFNDDSSGDGTDFTPYLVVTARSGGNDFEAKLTNNHPSKKGHLLTFQIRGTPLYDYDRFIVTQRDEDSIRQYGERPLTVEMVYQTSAEFAKSVANYLISLSSRAPAVVSSLTLMANTSAARLADILTLEVGDRIGLAETQTGLTTASGSQARNYFINQISLHAWDRGLMRATYTLSSGNQLAAWELGTVGASELDQTTVLGL